MIVKHCESGWEIVSHYAHGLLAGKIASQLKSRWMPEHWVDVLTGIIEHDDHLLDFEEKNYLTENGTPKDFTMEGGSDSETLEHARRVYSNSMQKSQMIAYLTGRHLEFLYATLAESYAPMRELLDEIESLRKSQRKLYGLTKKEAGHVYDMMLFSDRCSLILCQDEVPEVGRKLEVNKTINGEQFFICRTGEGNLTVEPWPFETDSFQLDFEYRILDSATFDDNKSLKTAIDAAQIKMRSYFLKATD